MKGVYYLAAIAVAIIAGVVVVELAGAWVRKAG